MRKGWRVELRRTQSQKKQELLLSSGNVVVSGGTVFFFRDSSLNKVESKSKNDYSSAAMKNGYLGP